MYYTVSFCHILVLGVKRKPGEGDRRRMQLIFPTSEIDGKGNICIKKTIYFSISI